MIRGVCIIVCYICIIILWAGIYNNVLGLNDLINSFLKTTTFKTVTRSEYGNTAASA